MNIPITSECNENSLGRLRNRKYGPISGRVRPCSYVEVHSNSIHDVLFLHFPTICNSFFSGNTRYIEGNESEIEEIQLVGHPLAPDVGCQTLLALLMGESIREEVEDGTRINARDHH